MKILGQKVARATVEVDGLVQGRIGTGLVLMLGIREGTSDEEIETAASKVMKLKLWPETLPGEEMPKPPKLANVVDKGYEVLVLLQQSLCASFPSAAPSLKEVMEPAEAQLLFEDFVKRLQQQYQEEMVVAAPQRGRIESTSDGEIFDLSALAHSSGRRAGTEKITKPPSLHADVSSMTRALKVLKTMERSKRDIASAQLYKLMGDPKFQQLLADADEVAAVGFAEALEEASPFFSREQQEEITDWTGVSMTSDEAKTGPKIQPKVEKEELEELEEEEEEEEELLEAEVTSEQLARQLEELREEARDPQGFAARKACASKAAALKPARRPSTAPKPKPPKPSVAAVQGWQRPAEPKKPPEPKTPPPGYLARQSVTSSVARVPLPKAKGSAGRSRRLVEGSPLDEWDRPKEELEDGDFRQAGKRRSAFESGPSKFMKGTLLKASAPMTPAPEDLDI